MPVKNGQTSLAIIIFLLAVGLIIFLSISKFPIHCLVILLLALILFIIALIKTDVALVILILSTLFSPELELGAIPGRTVVVRADDILLIVVFFGWIAKMAIYKELGLLKATELNKPIFSYIFICILSTLLGVLSGTVNIKYAFFYILKYIEYFLLFFMVVNNIKSLAQIKIFIFFIFFTCFFVNIYGWSQIGTGARVSAPFEGKAGEANTFAGYLLFMIALILGLILYPESRRQKFFLLGFLFFVIVTFLFTLSRGTWLASFPMFFTFIVINKKSRLYLILVLIIAIIFLPYILPHVVHERVKTTFVHGRTYTIFGKRISVDEATGLRLDSWRYGIIKWSKRPVFGYGVPAGIVVDNQYARVLREVGTIGFLIFIWLMVRIFKAGWRCYITSEDNNFAKGLSLGFLGGFIGLLFHGVTVETFILIRIMEPFWFVTAIIVSLPSLLKKGKENE